MIIPALIAAFLFSTIQCAHQDDVLDDIGGSEYEYGTDIINAAVGYAPDIGHSSVRWESQYTGVGALMTGRFDEFNMDVDFDEFNPENTTLSGTVSLASVNTGEPGRDDGCLQGTLGTADNPDATIVSTSVEKDGVGGYNVTMDLTFHGVTSEVIGKLTYIRAEYFDETSGIRCAPLYIGGFTLEFDFLAKSVFGVESSNIADRMTVKVNIQMKYIIDVNNC